MPKKLYWVVTNSCNLKCRYCYYQTRIKNQTTPSHKLFPSQELIDDISRIFDKVILTGGEPLTYPKIFSLISTLKTKGLKVGILTNGTLLNRSRIKQLMASYIDEISISLDSLILNVNDDLRGQTKKVFQAINDLLRYRHDDLKIEIMQTITRRNVDSIVPMIEFCFEKQDCFMA